MKHRDLYCWIWVLWDVLTGLWLLDVFSIPTILYWLILVFFGNPLCIVVQMEFLKCVREVSEEDYQVYRKKLWFRQSRKLTSNHPTVRLFIRDKKIIDRFASASILLTFVTVIIKDF